MEGNRDDSERCITRALDYFRKGDKSNALKFAQKALRLYPSQKAQDLISQIEGSTSQGEQDESPENSGSAAPGAHGTEGTARRRRVNSGSNNDSTDSSEAKYTKEQLISVNKIKKCKDYYEILNVSKDCSEDELKKSYRKLALKFHPDKNHAPGATDAFKAIGNAFAVLSDPEKRRRYDQYGSEAERAPSRHQGGFYQYDYSRGFEGDISAEELFNMFFGGGFPSGQMRSQRHYRTRTHYTHAHNHDTSENNFAFLLQLSPLLFMILLSLLSSFLVSDPVYNLSPDRKYTTERKTENMKVPYYVKNDFSTEYTGSIRRLERQIEEEYVSNLRSECFRERSHKEGMLWRARNYGDSRMYEKAQNLKTPVCDKLQKMYGG